MDDREVVKQYVEVFLDQETHAETPEAEHRSLGPEDFIKCHTVPHSVPHLSPVPHSVPHSMFESFTGLFVAFRKIHTYFTGLHIQGHKSS